MAVYSFLDQYDLSGKTIVPFCTSGGSAFSDTVDAIKNAEVLEGLHVSASSSDDAKEEVCQWLTEIGMLSSK